jgi:hypothetical protein
MTANSKQDDQFSELEVARRRDAVVKHMINTPPKPHSEMKIGKRKSRKRPSKKEGF